MAITAILILAVLWAVVLLPPLLRARTEHRPASSIGDFNYRLGVLGRTHGHPKRRARAVALSPIPGAPRVVPARHSHMSNTQRRRRDVLITLLGAMGVTLVAALVTRSVTMWTLQLGADALVASYVAMLLHFKNALSDRHTKVRYLPQRKAQPLMLRRTGSS